MKWPIVLIVFVVIQVWNVYLCTDKVISENYLPADLRVNKENFVSIKL